MNGARGRNGLPQGRPHPRDDRPIPRPAAQVFVYVSICGGMESGPSTEKPLSELASPSNSSLTSVLRVTGRSALVDEPLQHGSERECVKLSHESLVGEHLVHLVSRGLTGAGVRMDAGYVEDIHRKRGRSAPQCCRLRIAGGSA